MTLHKRFFRLMFLLLTVIVLMVVSFSIALAAPPANDDFDNATVVPGLSFTDSIDTSEATTAFDDPDCIGNGPTVWYSFTPTEGMQVEANTFGSDYDTTLSVYTGSRDALTQIACNDDTAGLQSQVIFEAIAGETYFFMVGAFASGTGGNLVFSVDVAPPPFKIDLIIDEVGSVIPSKGVATVRGTVTCSRPAFVDLFGELARRIGRVIVRGTFFSFFECDGETPWSAVVISETGPFVGGKAEASAFAFGFADFEFNFDEEHRTVRLRGSPAPRPYYASLLKPPNASRIALTIGLLSFGLIAGLVLVVGPPGRWKRRRGR
jgi:hypothetical protein